MKRVVLVLVALAIIAGGAFALDLMSAGGGIVYSGNFTAGMDVKVPGFGEIAVDTPSTYFGVYGFFDVQYAEISVGYLFGSMDAWKVSFMGMSQTLVDAIDVQTLSLGLLGKFPIDLGGIILFPALGIDYYYVLSSDPSYSDCDKMSELWLRAGVGLDFNLSDSLFLRATALFGLQLPTELQNDMIDLFKAMAPGGIDATARMGIGAAIKLAIGFKL